MPSWQERIDGERKIAEMRIRDAAKDGLGLVSFLEAYGPPKIEHRMDWIGVVLSGLLMVGAWTAVMLCVLGAMSMFQ